MSTKKKKIDQKKVQDAFHNCIEQLRKLSIDEQEAVLFMLCVFIGRTG